MGIYLNPGNDGFAQIRKAEYIDKTGMIEYINATLETPDKMTCVTRPRRFGKSYAAKMLAAYYDRTCDSRNLFEDLKIAGTKSFRTYLNHYDVIYLDITRFIALQGEWKDIVQKIQLSVIREMKESFPGCLSENEVSLINAVSAVSEKKGNRFYVIIDEWDALFREAKSNEKLQREYVQLLRGLFKGGIATDKTIAGAYLTGILPIKKYGTESAMTDFQEYTMVDAAFMAEFVGFTENEVKRLCEKYRMDFDGMKMWYDGYALGNIASVYSPNSVMQAVKRKTFGNYWTKTESFEALTGYINMNMDGLRDAIVAMLGGEKVFINPLSFQNDMVSFRQKDDILTLLVHLGYLAYDADRRKVYIPNLEVSDSFELAVQGAGWSDIGKALQESEYLLEATIEGNEAAVAAALDEVHSSTASALRYNDENSLSCALTIAYYTARKDYITVREFPSGKGFADLAFIPRKHTDRPAMIVELKYDETSDCAIRQIRERRYDGALKDYVGKLLLVGINYDKKTKEHTCRIEQV